MLNILKITGSSLTHVQPQHTTMRHRPQQQYIYQMAKRAPTKRANRHFIKHTCIFSMRVYPIIKSSSNYFIRRNQLTLNNYNCNAMKYRRESMCLLMTDYRLKQSAVQRQYMFVCVEPFIEVRCDNIPFILQCIVKSLCHSKTCSLNAFRINGEKNSSNREASYTESLFYNPQASLCRNSVYMNWDTM